MPIAQECCVLYRGTWGCLALHRNLCDYLEGILKGLF